MRRGGSGPLLTERHLLIELLLPVALAWQLEGHFGSAPASGFHRMGGLVLVLAAIAVERNWKALLDLRVFSAAPLAASKVGREQPATARLQAGETRRGRGPVLGGHWITGAKTRARV
jgi:hypothetical protein